MKKILFAVLLSALSSQLWASPAYPGKIKVKKADGTVVEARLMGDEYDHWLLFDDGTVSERKTAPRRAKTVGRRKMRLSDVPTKGKLPILIVLVNFSDKQFQTANPLTYYNNFCTQTGFSENGAQGCCAEWYKTVSNGLYEPQFKVVGPVTVSQTSAYYAGDDGVSNTYNLIKEIVPLIDWEVNFKDYDTDGDGKCDNIFCIYAGYGQADTGNTSYIWPHNAEVTDYQEEAVPTSDGVTVDRYTVTCEMNGQTYRTAGIGTFIHEFGHVLGLPDLYQTAGTETCMTPGTWDVMDMGVYNNQQNTPPAFSAYERMSLGWLTPETLPIGGEDYVDVPALYDTYKAYKVPVPNDANEFFIVENRQQKGWDAYLPGKGVLVWHLDEDQAYWDANVVNNVPDYQRVDIVEANGVASTSSATASFPGYSKITTFRFKSWYNKPVFGFSDVKEEDGTVKLLVNDGSYNLETPVVSVSNITSSTASITWTAPQYAKTYAMQIKQAGEVIRKIDVMTDTHYDVAGLELETEYTVEVTAVCDEEKSDAGVATFTTTSQGIEEQKVSALAATEVTATSFMANWQPLTLAESYEVRLYSRTESEATTSGTGFDECTSEKIVLPQYWETNVSSISNANYGEKAPSLKFTLKDQYLLIKDAGNKITKLSFWYLSNSRTNELTVMQLVNGNWEQVGDVLKVETASQGYSISLDINSADAVKLVLTKKSGYTLVDDVYMTHTNFTTKLENTVTTTATSYEFTALDATKKYVYDVRGTAGGKYSYWSDQIVVEQSEPTGVEEVSGGSRGFQEVSGGSRGFQEVSGGSRGFQEVSGGSMYNVAGQRVSACYKGIRIINGRKVVD